MYIEQLKLFTSNEKKNSNNGPNFSKPACVIHKISKQDRRGYLSSTYLRVEPWHYPT